MSTRMDMEEQQPPVKKPRMDYPPSKEESTDEIVIQNDGAEENEALRGKLREAGERAQMAKNELEKVIQQQKNPQKLEALLANVIAILKEHTEEDETTSSSGEPEIPQNSLDRHRRVPLPLELNCQIFECLKFGIQRKFIGGLGRGIYAIFRQKVLTKSKRVRNPEQNGWEFSNTRAMISFNELCASDNTGAWLNVFAQKGFPITGELSRTNNFPGTILYYFEVTQIATAPDDFGYCVGLSDGNNSDGFSLGGSPNSYMFCGDCQYYLAGEECFFESPNGVNGEAKSRDTTGDTIGCGILLNPEDRVSIFSTYNGILLGKPIPISPTVDCLYPTVYMSNTSLKANFGTDPAKPFEYNIEECPGMGYDD